MIPRSYITEWRNYAPWILDSQVEHDLILSRLLVELFSNEKISSSLLLRGGTALYKIYFNNKSIRFSEDIDLVQKKNKPIGQIMSEIRNVCEPILGIPQYKQTKGRVTFYYKVISEIPPIVPLKFKIEINTREHFSIYDLKNIEYKMNSRWFKGRTLVKTYSINELLGTKMRALYQRKRGRDLFDLWYSLENYKCNSQKIIKSFQFYIKNQKVNISKKEYIKNLETKLNDKQFIYDTKNILNPTINFNFKEGYQLILKNLIKYL